MNPYRDICTLKKQPPTAARQALQQAFLSTCAARPYAAVSVTALCKRAHVARTTFYALYSNTDALLEEIEDALIVDLLAVNPPGATQRDYIRQVTDFVAANRTALHVLLVDQPDARLARKWKTAVKFHLWDTVGAGAGPDNSGLALEMIASMALGAYIWYLEHPAAFDLESVARMVRLALETLP